MEEIRRHLWWVDRHIKWSLRRLARRPSTLDKHQVRSAIVQVDKHLESVRKLLEQ